MTKIIVPLASLMLIAAPMTGCSSDDESDDLSGAKVENAKSSKLAFSKKEEAIESALSGIMDSGVKEMDFRFTKDSKAPAGKQWTYQIVSNKIK